MSSSSSSSFAFFSLLAVLLHLLLLLLLLTFPFPRYVGGPIQLPFLKDFYQRAYTALRQANYTGLILMSDGWTNSAWNDFMSPPQYEGVLLDTHLYRCFGGGNLEPYENIVSVCEQTKPMLANLTQRDWTVVGEYSLCLTNSSIASTAEWDKFASFYSAASLTAFGSNSASGPAKGSFFWNFKIGPGEALPVRLEWDFLLGLELGFFPQNEFEWGINGCP